MALLEVNDLHTSFFTDAGEVKAVDGVSFRLDHGKVLGIVGESGSGKSVTAYSVMQILAPTGKIVSGSVKFDGQELVGADEKLLRSVRGNRISIIFQDPMTSLNPTYTIGRQLMERMIEECRVGRYHALSAGITEGNEDSCSRDEKLGFRKVSHFEKVGLKFGRWLDVVDYELIIKPNER